jgi:hypothetical protein
MLPPPPKKKDHFFFGGGGCKIIKCRFAQKSRNMIERNTFV